MGLILLVLVLVMCEVIKNGDGSEKPSEVFANYYGVSRTTLKMHGIRIFFERTTFYLVLVLFNLGEVCSFVE